MGGLCGYAFSFVLLLVVVCGGRISDRRLCGDPKCSEPVSYARSLIRYISDAEGVLSFWPNENVIVFSKSAGSRRDLWGVEIRGKRGYAPMGLLQEYKILKKNLTHVVPTEEHLLKAGSQNLNLQHKNNSITTTDTPQYGGSVSPKTLIDLNSEHAPLLSSDEQVSKGDGKEQTEDKPLPFQDGVTAPFELVDGTTIYLPPEEDSQVELLPIQATMTSGMSSSIQVEAVSMSVDSAPKLEPSTLNTQENEMKSIMPPSSPASDSAPKLQLSTLSTQEKEMEASMPPSSPASDSTSKLQPSVSAQENKMKSNMPPSNSASDSTSKLQPSTLSTFENVMKSDTLSSSPVSEGEKHLNEKQTLPETEIETEGSEDIYTMFANWISEGSVTEEQKSISEKIGGTENAEKSWVENSESKQKEMSASEDEKRTDDEAEEEEDKDEDDYVDEYNDDDDEDEEEEEDESTSQRTPDMLLDELSRKEANAQNEKPTEQPTGNNLLSEKFPIEEEKLFPEILPTLEKSDEDKSKNTVSGKAEYHRDVEMVFESSDGEEDSEQDGTKLEEKQSGTNLNADDKAVDGQDSVSIEELSGCVEKLTSTVVLPGNEETASSIRSVNNIPDLKNEDGTEKSTKEISTSSSDVEEHLSPTSSTEMNLDDSHRIAFESESSEINANKTDVNERQELSTHEEEEKPGESLFVDLQPEATLDNVLPVQDEQSVSSSETLSSISDYSVDEISTISTDETANAENVKVDSEMLSDERSSKGLFLGIAGSFWSSFENLLHIFMDGSKVELSESREPDDAQKLQDVPNERMTDEAISSPWSEPQPSTASFAIKEETQACVVVDSASGTDSDCDAIGSLSRAYKKSQETDESAIMDMQKSFNTVLYVIITAVTVLLFSLGHYYIEKKRRDGSLVAKINELEKALLVSSKECIILKDDLEAAKEKLEFIEHSSTDSIETVATLNIQLQEAKVANAALEEQVASLEKELEQATEAGLELNRMLTEFLSTQHGSDSLMKSVEHLQKQLDSQQGTITTMTESLNVKNAENENLQIQLKFSNEKINSLEEELQKVTEKLEVMQTEKMKIMEESADKSKEFEKKVEEITKSKEDELSAVKFELIVLQDSVTELRDNLVTKESEIAVLQDCIKQMKNYDGDDTLQALLDVGETKAELKLMTLERNTLLEKLQIEEDARKLLEDHVKVIKEEVVRLRESYEEAEKEKTEAQTRLEVLSNYFKEKETQLQKELGLQEAMCLQKEGDASSTHERIKSLQEEIENYNGELPSSSDNVDSNKDSLKKKKKVKRVRQLKGSQNEALKKEILDQERGLKGQIASLEKKAHENWIAARQAERKLEESKQEAGQLRNRLTVVEKNITNVSKNGETTIMNDRMPANSNGELGASPVHAALADSSSSPLHYHDGLPSPPLPVMLSAQPLTPTSFMGMHPGVFIPPPPPPGAPFMPPPPPPLFPGDRRPPPLGRISSPPPPRRYSSPPPPESRNTFSPYEHSPPTSPLSPNQQYRSPPPINEPPSRFKHTSPPPPLPHFSTRLPPHWDDPHGTPRSGFRPLPPPTHRDSPREPKGSTLSSGHSSESLEKSSRHSGRV